MTLRPAAIITLTHGSDTVELVPSLRAAAHLERLYDGFPALLTHVQEFHLATVRVIIATAATDRSQAKHFLDGLIDAPLKIIRDLTVLPCLELITALLIPADDKHVPDPTAKPTPWADLFADLFKIGTGWLGWTPAATWAATPAEIVAAFDGHVAQLKATHGSADEEDAEAKAAQRADNIAEGLDPDFDRAGLRRLKANL